MNTANSVIYDVDIYFVFDNRGEAILGLTRSFDFPREWSYSRCSDAIKNELRLLGIVCEYYFVINQQLPF
ncbi:hypothetical protein [Dipodfec virus UOA04_Rod_997]|nr:hypothetical protein [Dipodfec virus UOA04_Rod_997]